MVFESFLPDVIGHAKDFLQAEEFCRVLSRSVDAVIGGLDAETTLLISSDHGNFEDFSTGSHTANPVLLLALGPDARAFSGLSSITDVTPCILSVLGGRSAAGRAGMGAPKTVSAVNRGPY